MSVSTNAAIKLSKYSFGLQVPYVSGSNNHPEIGYGIYRVWGGRLTWRRLESATTKGVFNWTEFDIEMNYAKANGLRPIFTLGQPSPYATGGAAGGPLAAGGEYNNKPASVQDYTDYARAVATRALAVFGPGMVWELYNEVTNLAGENFWDGPIPTLVAYAAALRPVLKAIDPTCVILTPSVTASTTYVNQAMELMFAGGIGQYVDGIAVHGYVTPAQPEAIIPYLRNYRAAAAKYGYGYLPVWDTESTYASWRKVPGAAEESLSSGATMSDQQRVAYVLRRWLSGLAAGYSVQCHYGAQFEAAGAGADNFKALCLWDGANVLNAGGVAMRNFLRLMVGATVQSFQSRSRGVFALSVLLADGTPGVWLWTPDGVTVPFPQAASVDLALKVDYLNVRRSITGSEAIGNVPKLYLSANTSMRAVDISTIMAAIEQPVTNLLTSAVWTGTAMVVDGTNGSGTLGTYSGANTQLPVAAPSWSFVPTPGTPQINIPVNPALLQPGRRHRIWAEVELLTPAPWRLRLLDSNWNVTPGQELDGSFTLPVTGPGIQRVVTDFDYPAGSAAPPSLRLQFFLDNASDVTKLSGCRVGVQVIDMPV